MQMRIREDSVGFRIIQGKEAKFGQFPSIALLGYLSRRDINGRQGTVYRCAGSLINRRYVLTAGEKKNPRLRLKTSFVTLYVCATLPPAHCQGT